VNTFATIVVPNKNKTSAQNLTSSDMFTSEFKKGIRKYWVSSGYFTQEHYDALVDSGLTFAIDTNDQLKPIAILSAIGLNRIIEE